MMSKGGAVKKSCVLKDITWLSLVFCLIFGLFLGSRPLSVPDEGRYTEIPRQMVETGDYVTPRLNGVKYFEKPPLIPWLTTLSLKIFDVNEWGVNEWALRFWPALFAYLGCLATFLYGQRFWGRKVGIASSLILASNLLYYAHSRILILDMPVAALISCGLFAFHAAVFEAQKTRQYALLMVFFVASALASLTKGLIGIVLPGCVILIWVFLHKRYDALKLAFHPVGLLLFFCITLPWHILASFETKEFFEFYVIHEQFLRFLTTAHARVQPVWFFIPVLFLGLFPWVGFLYTGFKQAYSHIKSKQDENNAFSFLLIWFGFILLFFSLSKSKLIPYIVPVIPPLSIIMGYSIVNLLFARDSLAEKGDSIDASHIKPYKIPVMTFLALTGALAIGVPIALFVRDQLGNMNIVPYAFLTVVAALLGLVSVAYFYVKKRIKAVVAGMFFTALCMFLPLNKAWVHVEGRSLYGVIQTMKTSLSDEDTIVAWNVYYQDLPVYTNRRITVVEGFNELTFGTTIEDVSAWMISESDFAKLLDSGKPLYIVLRKVMLDEFFAKYPQAKKLHVVDQSVKDILLTNKPLS